MRREACASECLGEPMFRYALVTYFLATTLAGPSLCFCAMTRLATSMLQECSLPTSDTNAHPCCVKRLHVIRESPASPCSGTDSPQKKCPCQEHVDKYFLLLVSEVTGNSDSCSAAFYLLSIDGISADREETNRASEAFQGKASFGQLAKHDRQIAFQVAIC
jgi:hypothetical protein